MQLREALKKEKMLIREVYHRVKNNMAVIASLLHLQASASKDERIVSALKDSGNRVRTMAALHEILHSSADPCAVELDDYLSKIAQTLHHGIIDNPDRVSIEVETDSVEVHSEIAISCGLIVNELITNAVKHAFPKDRKGSVRLGLKRLDGDKVVLSVADNGVGLPEGFNIDSLGSLGMQIVSSLIKQIGGESEVISSNGTEFRITFNTDCECAGDID